MAILQTTANNKYCHVAEKNINLSHGPGLLSTTIKEIYNRDTEKYTM